MIPGLPMIGFGFYPEYCFEAERYKVMNEKQAEKMAMVYKKNEERAIGVNNINLTKGNLEYYPVEALKAELLRREVISAKEHDKNRNEAMMRLDEIVSNIKQEVQDAMFTANKYCLDFYLPDWNDRTKYERRYCGTTQKWIPYANYLPKEDF